MGLLLLVIFIVALFIFLNNKKEKNIADTTRPLSSYRVPLNVSNRKITDYQSLAKFIDEEAIYLKKDLQENEAIAMAMFRLYDQRREEVINISDYMTCLEKDYPLAFPIFKAFLQYKNGVALSEKSKDYLNRCRYHKSELLDDYFTGFLAARWEGYCNELNKEGMVAKDLARKIIMFLDFFNLSEIETKLSPSLRLNTTIAALRFLNFNDEDEIAKALDELAPVYKEKDTEYYKLVMESYRELLK